MPTYFLRITSASHTTKYISLNRLMTFRTEANARYAIVDANKAIVANAGLYQEGATVVAKVGNQKVLYLSGYNQPGINAQFDTDVGQAVAATAPVSTSRPIDFLSQARGANNTMPQPEVRDTAEPSPGGDGWLKSMDGSSNNGLLLLGGAAVTGIAAALAGGNDKNNGSVSPSHVVSINLVAGPVVKTHGLRVVIYDAKGTQLASQTLGEDGQVSINLGSYSGVIVAKVLDADSGADFVDEASLQAVDLNTSLLALGVVNAGAITLNLNPLTTLAAIKAGVSPDKLFTTTISESNVNKANATIAHIFGLPDLHSVKVIPTITNNGQNNPDYTPDTLNNSEKYGALLAALSGLDALNGGTIQTSLNQLAQEINVTTGSLSDAGIVLLSDGASKAGEKNGATSNSLTSIVSEITAQTNASLTIHAPSVTVIGGSAQAIKISGTVSGASTVSVHIAGNTRSAEISNGHWSYQLQAGDFAAIGAGTELITAEALLSNQTTVTAKRSMVFDFEAPTVAISSNAASLSAGETATITLRFSELPSGFNSSDIQLTGGSLSGLAVSTSDAKLYTAKLTPNNQSEGTINLSIAAAAFSDKVGNVSNASNVLAIPYNTKSDTTAPTLAISSNVSSLKSGETATISFTFSEEPVGFSGSDVVASGGSLGTLTGSGKVYSATFTPATNSTIPASITVASGAYTDTAGNAGGAGASPSISIDTQAPSLVISSNVSSLKAGETATLTFTFSEEPQGFAQSDVVLNGGTLSNFAGSGKIYSATFTATNGTDTASVSVKGSSYSDAAGNAGGADASLSIAITAAIGPSVSITSSNDMLKFDSQATITFTFSEAPTGFTQDDITISGGTLSDFNGSGTVYHANLIPQQGISSSTAITVAAGSYTNATGKLGQAGSSTTISIDTLAPTLNITSDATSLKADAVANITLSFSEVVTGFDQGDIRVTGGSLTNFTGTGATYSAQFVPATNGATAGSITVAKGLYSDAIGNPNAADSTLNFNIDTQPPSLTITSNVSSLKAGETAQLSFSFDESVVGFTASDIMVSGATLSNFSGSGATYTATLIPAENSTATASAGVTRDSYSDGAGNAGRGDRAFTINVDTRGSTAPTVTLSKNSALKLQATGVNNLSGDDPRITTLGSDGSYVIAWHGMDPNRDRHVYVQKVNADNTISAQTPFMSEALGFFPNIIAIGNSGEYVAAWTTASDDVAVQQFNADGSTSGHTLVQLNAEKTSYISPPSICTVGNAGEYVVAWVVPADSKKIFVQKFNANGSISGQPMAQVETNGYADIASNNNAPKLTALGSNGQYVLVWVGKDQDPNYTSIYVQQFNANGSTTGFSQVKLDATSISNQSDRAPQVVSLGDSGKYIVGWVGAIDIGHSRFYLQTFNADGTKTGQEPITLDAKSLDQRITAIGKNGAYMVSWNTYELATNTTTAHVQKFNADGSLAGENQVKLELDGQGGSATWEMNVTTLGDSGRYVISWTGLDNTKNYAVYSQSFNADGSLAHEKPIKFDATGVSGKNDRTPQVIALGNDGKYAITWYGVDADGYNNVYVQQVNANGSLYQVSSSKAGSIYIVHNSITPASVGDITGTSDNLLNKLDVIAANQSIAIDTKGLRTGEYRVYSADTSGYLSTAASGDIDIGFDANVVVFDLVEGVSSSHSNRTFDANISYTIYLRVDSASQSLSDDGNGPGFADSWGSWKGGANLGADDKIVLVGFSNPVLIAPGQNVANVTVSANAINWQQAAVLNKNGLLTRKYNGVTAKLDLFSGSWAANPNTLAVNYLTAMLKGVLTSQGLA